MQNMKNKKLFIECSIENDYTQDFKNCKIFYRCLNNELVSFSCPLDTIFDATLKLCVCSYPGSECTTSSTDNPMPSTISAKSNFPLYFAFYKRLFL